jgi:hypothetical protein
MPNLTLPPDWGLLKFNYNQPVNLKRNDDISTTVELPLGSLEYAYEANLEAIEVRCCSCKFIPALLSHHAYIQAVLTDMCGTLHQSLKPSEYYQCWTFQILHLKNYKQAYDQAIAYACSLLPTEVQLWAKEWHKHPNYVRYLMRLVDIIKRFPASGMCADKWRGQPK